MIPTVVFATGNANKLREVREIANGRIRILGLSDVGLDHLRLTETGTTYAENACEKVSVLHRSCAYPCFAEDSGLEVQALHGVPGIHTARYAGLTATTNANIEKLLGELAGISDRGARFYTVIALAWRDEIHIFDGEVKGSISGAPSGRTGFGYDPVFIPEGFSTTFAELSSGVKNRISHRAKAMEQMIRFIEKQTQT